MRRGVFDFNRDGKLSAVEHAAQYAVFRQMQEDKRQKQFAATMAEVRNALRESGADSLDVAIMQDQEIVDMLEDAGLSVYDAIGMAGDELREALAGCDELMFPQEESAVQSDSMDEVRDRLLRAGFWDVSLGIYDQDELETILMSAGLTPEDVLQMGPKELRDQLKIWIDLNVQAELLLDALEEAGLDEYDLAEMDDEERIQTLMDMDLVPEDYIDFPYIEFEDR